MGLRGNRFVIGVASVAAVLIAGCAELLPAQARDAQVAGKTSLRPLLDPDSLAIPGTDTAEVVATIGEPTERATSQPPKRQRPGVVTTLMYDGLEVVVRELERPPRTFISSLVITSDDYATQLPIGVGSSREEIESVLGEPSESEGAEVVYTLTDSGDRCIVLYEGDVASRLTFHFN